MCYNQLARRTEVENKLFLDLPHPLLEERAKLGKHSWYLKITNSGTVVSLGRLRTILSVQTLAS